MMTSGKVKVYARARTSVPQSWLKPNQQLLPAAKNVESSVLVGLWDWHKFGDIAAVVGDIPPWVVS
jgi:hypothetical protein